MYCVFERGMADGYLNDGWRWIGLTVLRSTVPNISFSFLLCTLRFIDYISKFPHHATPA